MCCKKRTYYPKSHCRGNLLPECVLFFHFKMSCFGKEVRDVSHCARSLSGFYICGIRTKTNIKDRQEIKISFDDITSAEQEYH